uniref:GLOBIN domain-containing protein n=1 Tax=Trichuris muris TaxID=70415 RepID=A0A5S6R0Z9_TRIMR
MEENEERLAKSVWTAMRERFNGRVGTEIFRQLFIRCPELKVIFGVTSISDEVALSDTKLHRHTTIFQDVIDVVITNIGNASILTDSLIDLGAQHWELTKRGFRPTYWLLFGDVMLDLVTSVTRKLPSRRTAVKVWRRVIVFMLDCMQLGQSWCPILSTEEKGRNTQLSTKCSVQVTDEIVNSRHEFNVASVVPVLALLLLILVSTFLVYAYLLEFFQYQFRLWPISSPRDSANSRHGHLLNSENNNDGLRHKMDSRSDTPTYNERIAQAQMEFIQTSEDREKCGIPLECGDKEVFIAVHSGKESTTSPYICINGRVIMSAEINGAGRGLNLIVLEPRTRIVVRCSNFDTYSVKDNTALDIFLSQLTTGQLLIAVTHDDAWTTLSTMIKETLQSLGSSMINNLNFRDSWFFVGQKGIKGFTPFENLHRSNGGKRWAPPVSARMCVPYKIDGLNNPKSPSPTNGFVNQRKEKFCKSHDGYFEFCNEDDVFSEAAERPPQLLTNISKGAISKVPILVIPGFDLNELCSTLRSIEVQPGLNASNVLVVYEDNFQEVKDLAEVFSFTSKRISNRPTYHEYLAEAIQSVWDFFPKSEYAIVIEEEAVVSPDFLFFMSQLLPVLESEPTFVSVSAWNVNGFKHLSNDTRKVYLTEGFPGFGFMLKKSFYMKNMKGRMNACCDRRSWHGWKTNVPHAVYTIVPEVSRISRKPYINTGRYSSSLAALFQHPRIMNSETNSLIRQVDQLGLGTYSNNIQSLIAITETLSHLNCTKGDHLVPIVLPSVRPPLYGFSIRLSTNGITMDSVCSCFQLYCPKESSFRNHFNGILRFNYYGQPVFIISA